MNFNFKISILPEELQLMNDLAGWALLVPGVKRLDRITIDESENVTYIFEYDLKKTSVWNILYSLEHTSRFNDYHISVVSASKNEISGFVKVAVVKKE